MEFELGVILELELIIILEEVDIGVELLIIIEFDDDELV